jgi:hypothetical protein
VAAIQSRRLQLRFGMPMRPAPTRDDRDYQVPFPFTGKIDKLTISVERPKLTLADIARLKEAYEKSRRTGASRERLPASFAVPAAAAAHNRAR